MPTVIKKYGSSVGNRDIQLLKHLAAKKRSMSDSSNMPDSSKTIPAGSASLRDVLSVYEKARDSGKLKKDLISAQAWQAALGEISAHLATLKTGNTKSRVKGYAL